MLEVNKKHSIPVIILHWATVVLVVFALAAVFSADFFEESSVEDCLINVHKTIGVVVLIFVLARIIFRFKYRRNYFYSDASRNNPVAQAVHSTLYLILLALPMLGVLESIYSKENIGVIPSATFLSVNKSVFLSEIFHETHEMLASFFMVLILGHVFMAFYHKKKHPDIFNAMLPSRKKS